MYAETDPGEPTGGAGAVALIIDEQASIAAISPISYPYNKPAFDFWRPTGQRYPFVDGKFSMEYYKEAVRQCFDAWLSERLLSEMLKDFHALCFHVPFPKMVKKTFLHLCEHHQITPQTAEILYSQKVEPFVEWNTHIGNAYTANLWFAVARALQGIQSNKKLIGFSYVSGFGAELLEFTSDPEATTGNWHEDIEEDFRSRKKITGKEYADLRGMTPE